MTKNEYMVRMHDVVVKENYMMIICYLQQNIKQCY